MKCLLLGAIALWLAVGTCYAAVPPTIGYQGYVTGAGGAPLNGTVSMTFSVYANANGGTAMWTETQPAVTVTNGVFDAVLGSVTPFNFQPSDSPGYLGISVGTDPEMTPRQKLNSVPYAFKARVADALTSIKSVIEATQVTVLSTTGVASASCPVGQPLVSGGCFCTGKSATATNFGVVFACYPDGPTQTYLGGCYDLTFTAGYGHSPIQVYALCLKDVVSLNDSKSASATESTDPRIEQQLVTLREQQQQMTQATGKR